MIVCENRALFEFIRARCKRTETGTVVRIATQTRFETQIISAPLSPGTDPS